MIDVICWKWHKRGYRSVFTAEAVNIMRNMLARNLHAEHRLTCVTDDPEGIDSDIRVIDIRTLPSYAWLAVPNPSSNTNPSCYVRLFTFSAEAAAVFGERIVSIDLDMVITGDVTSLFDRDDDFVIWGGQAAQPQSHAPYNPFNGSLFMLRTGSHCAVYDDFDPRRSPGEARRGRCNGSDQGWIAYKLQGQAATWGEADGICSYRNHVLPARGKLSEGCRVVAFHGQHDPWDDAIKMRHPWVREHYC